MECLVLWVGYKREEASWVREDNVTAAALRYVDYLFNSMNLITEYLIGVTQNPIHRKEYSLMLSAVLLLLLFVV